MAIVAPSDRWGFAVAARGGTVFWARRGTVVSQPAAGGAVVTLASGQRGVTAIAVDASNVYWASGRGGGGAASNLYFTEPGMVNDGAVVRVPLGGGAPTTLVTGQAGPGAIGVDATSVYWLDTGIGALMKISPK